MSPLFNRFPQRVGQTVVHGKHGKVDVLRGIFQNLQDILNRVFISRDVMDDGAVVFIRAFRLKFDGSFVLLVVLVLVPSPRCTNQTHDFGLERMFVLSDSPVSSLSEASAWRT